MTAWLTASDLIDELRSETAMLSSKWNMSATQLPPNHTTANTHCDTHNTNNGGWLRLLRLHKINFLKRQPHQELLIYWLQDYELKDAIKYH